MLLASCTDAALCLIRLTSQHQIAAPLLALWPFSRRFYESDDPTNSVIALKDSGWSTMLRANPTRLSSLKGKKKYQTFNVKPSNV